MSEANTQARDSKTISIFAERTMGKNVSFTIHYAVVRDLDAVEHHTADFRINEKGMMIDMEFVHTWRSFWVEKPLSVGDYIFFEAKMTHDLSVSLYGEYRDHMKIGGFWRVLGDGSLEHTGT